MSFNRLLYDNCSFQKLYNRNQNIFSYNMDNNKFKNNKEMRISKGIVAGNDVSVISGGVLSGERVVLESDLWGSTRRASNCSSNKSVSYTHLTLPTAVSV